MCIPIKRWVEHRADRVRVAGCGRGIRLGRACHHPARLEQGVLSRFVFFVCHKIMLNKSSQPMPVGALSPKYGVTGPAWLEPSVFKHRRHTAPCYFVCGGLFSPLPVCRSYRYSPARLSCRFHSGVVMVTQRVRTTRCTATAPVPLHVRMRFELSRFMFSLSAPPLCHRLWVSLSLGGKDAHRDCVSKYFVRVLRFSLLDLASQLCNISATLVLWISSFTLPS